MSHTTDSMTFEIFVRISFSSLLLFPGHGDIQKVSYGQPRACVEAVLFYRYFVLFTNAVTERNSANVFRMLGSEPNLKKRCWGILPR